MVGIVKQTGVVNKNSGIVVSKKMIMEIGLLLIIAVIAVFALQTYQTHAASNALINKQAQQNTQQMEQAMVPNTNTGPATSSQNAVTNGQETGSLLDQVKAALAPGAKIVYGNYGDDGYGPYVCYCTERDGKLTHDERGFFTLSQYLAYLKRINSPATVNEQQTTQSTAGVEMVTTPWYPLTKSRVIHINKYNVDLDYGADQYNRIAAIAWENPDKNAVAHWYDTVVINVRYRNTQTNQIFNAKVNDFGGRGLKFSDGATQFTWEESINPNNIEWQADFGLIPGKEPEVAKDTI